MLDDVSNKIFLSTESVFFIDQVSNCCLGDWIMLSRINLISIYLHIYIYLCSVSNVYS